MNRSSRRLFLLTWFCTIALQSRARAGSTDPVTLHNQLEDSWLDGDKDIEDLAVFRLAPQAIGGSRVAFAYVALEGFAARRELGGAEMGAHLIVQFPLERLWHRPPRVSAKYPSSAGSAMDSPRTVRGVAGLGSLVTLDNGMTLAPGRRSVGALLPIAADAAAGEKAPARPVVVIDLTLTRACVAAALRAMGLADDARLDGLSARARASAALPELRLRAMRTVDESGRVTLSAVDTSRYTEAGGATDWLEARLTFRLDRLLFADDEVALERIRIERSELRSRTTAKVLEALFEWQRAYALVHDPDLATDAHFAAVLRELEAAARLDVITDGWFGRFRASLKPAPS